VLVSPDFLRHRSNAQLYELPALQTLDFSRDKKYELSSQTRGLLKNLRSRSSGRILFQCRGNRTGRYQPAARIRVCFEQEVQSEIVDPFRSFTRAQELQTKYKFGANENIVILDIDGKSKFVNAADMAEFEMPDQMSMMMGQTSPGSKRSRASGGDQRAARTDRRQTEQSLSCRRPWRT